MVVQKKRINYINYSTRIKGDKKLVLVKSTILDYSVFENNVE